MSEISTRIAISADSYLVELRGEVDLQTEPDLRSIVEQFQASGMRHLVIDMRGVTFMDSRGIGMLVQLRRIAAHRGGTATLVGLSEKTQRLLRMTAVDTLFTLD